MSAAPPEPEPFAIATIAADRGRIGICRMPRTRADVLAVLDWRPSLVVSMTQAAEMAGFAALAFHETLARAGIGWRHFPVGDFGVPERGADGAWAALSAAIHAALDRGGGALLHCRAGLGRSGMVAMRLLVERGVPADAALRQMRSARPGAVETEAQAAWAGRTTPIAR